MDKAKRDKMSNDVSFARLCGWLKSFADRSGAGSAYVDLTCEDGSVFRIEYKPNKRKEQK